MELPNLTGWETMVTEDGNVLQAGAQSRPSNRDLDVSNTGGWITRAVVLQTYFPEEDDRNGWVSGGNQRCILCDVRTYGRFSRVLTKVPVLQRTHGLWDTDVYIPRASKINIEGGDMVGDASGSKPPTSAEKLDGDHVLVGFLDNDPSQPVVLPFGMAHPKSRYSPASGDGRVKRLRHNGTLVEWDDSGNLTIDATGAAKADLLADGSEDSNSGTGGVVTVKTKDGSDAVSQVRLNASGAALIEAAGGTVKLELTKDTTAVLSAVTTASVDAPLVELSTAPLESVMKATSYNTQLTLLMSLLTAYVTAVGAAFVAQAQHAPNAPIKPVLEAVAGPASALLTGITTFTAASPTWTSLKVKTG